MRSSRPTLIVDRPKPISDEWSMRIARGCSPRSNARSDLIFTMSDNTCLRHEPGHEFVFSWTRYQQHQNGGARRDRTDDLMLAKHALSQLSYGPNLVAVRRSPEERRLVGLGRFELPTSRLSSARSNQLSYKPELSTEATPHRAAIASVIPMTGLVHEERET